MSAQAHPAGPSLVDRKLPPVTEIGAASMVAVAVGLIYNASYLPKHAQTGVAIAILVLAAVLQIVARCNSSSRYSATFGMVLVAASAMFCRRLWSSVEITMSGNCSRWCMAAFLSGAPWAVLRAAWLHAAQAFGNGRWSFRCLEWEWNKLIPDGGGAIRPG